MVDQGVASYFHELSALLSSIQVTDRRGVTLSVDEGTDKALELLLSLSTTAGKIMLIGNGGSAAIVSHVQNDLCKAVGVRAMVFNEPPLLTALANDHGYGCVFERPVELWANTDDVLLAISSSGQSENILRAVQAAEARGCHIITFSGFHVDNPLRQMGDVNFYVPSHVYGYVEVSHMALAHFLTNRAMSAVHALSGARL